MRMFYCCMCEWQQCMLIVQEGFFHMSEQTQPVQESKGSLIFKERADFLDNLQKMSLSLG